LLSAPLYLKIMETMPGIELIDATEKMREIRMIKSPLEIDWLCKAAQITDAGGKAATQAIEDGKKERDVAVAAEFAMKSNGASELSFPTVLGSGSRTELIVPLPTEKKISNGELVLMDLGGRCNGYCGDLSRTKLCGRGNPNPKQKELFQVVLEMHKKAIESVRPGIRAIEIHGISNRVAEESGYGRFVKHMTGHGIGLEDHEKPILETDDMELLPNVVHSIEPGLYVPEVGGIRIEDLVLVTDSGRKVISSFERDLV
jgi:Xaa-Pro aminopeptidase